MNPIKSKHADSDVNKYTCWVVLSWINGCSQVERAFGEYSDAISYINWQLDDRTYTIEKTFFVDRQLPF